MSRRTRPSESSSTSTRSGIVSHSGAGVPATFSDTLQLSHLCGMSAFPAPLSHSSLVSLALTSVYFRVSVSGARKGDVVRLDTAARRTRYLHLGVPAAVL